MYNRAECAKELLAIGKVDVNSRDTKGCTPLFAACNNNAPACVDVLLRTPGIKVNLASDPG